MGMGHSCFLLCPYVLTCQHSNKKYKEEWINSHQSETSYFYYIITTINIIIIIIIIVDYLYGLNLTIFHVDAK
jgi:hypothetical protein